MEGNPNQDKTPKLKPWMVAVFAIVVILFLGMAIGGGMYNSLNASRQAVDADWAQVENVMQRRADLIPNLVASVKGEMQNEQEIFKSIAESRRQFETSNTQAEKLAADDELNARTTVLLNAVKESYPELASSEPVPYVHIGLLGQIVFELFVDDGRDVLLISEVAIRLDKIDSFLVVLHGLGDGIIDSRLLDGVHEPRGDPVIVWLAKP